MIRFGPGVSCASAKESANCRSGEPMLNIDRVAVHFRNDRIAAADREQRCDGEEGGQREERPTLGFHRRIPALRNAAPMLTGTITSRTSGNGQCRMPMAAKVATAMTGAITAEL